MRNAAIVLLAGVILLTFAACDETIVIDDWPPGNTPKGVLELIEDTFNNRDVETLDAALADDFTFHFDPDDVGTVIGDYTIPESWGREDMLAACANMFTEAYGIDFVITIESIGEPDEDAIEFTAKDVYVSLLVMVDPQNGYIASGFCDFRFVNENADGTENWVITDWWDKTAAAVSGGRGITPSSFGVILVTFR